MVVAQAPLPYRCWKELEPHLRFRTQKLVIECQSTHHVPLTNNVIVKLNEITVMVEDKSELSESDVDEIRSVFEGLVRSNERYDVDEIEDWFENEGSWKDRGPITRIANLSSYVQDKHQQTAGLRMLPDDGCGC